MTKRALPVINTREGRANVEQVERWIRLARERASLKMGIAHTLFTPDVKCALACAELVAILASQDETLRVNGDTIAAACEALLDWY